MNDRVIFSADLGKLPQMLRWVREHLQASGMDEVNVRKVELACEEAFVNIIQHAYKNTAGNVEIEFRKVGKSHIEIEIRDSGPPFNLLKQKSTFDPLASIEEREIGGLGILFIRQYMDEIRYRREKNTNVLVFVKKITGPSQSK